MTHTLGNLERNLVGIAGGLSVERDRAAEFADQPLTAGEAARRWAELRDTARAIVDRLDAKELKEHVAHDHRGLVTRLEVLVITARHAAEHLGQAELTRDLYRATHRAASPRR